MGTRTSNLRRDSAFSARSRNGRGCRRCCEGSTYYCGQNDSIHIQSGVKIKGGAEKHAQKQKGGDQPRQETVKNILVRENSCSCVKLFNCPPPKLFFSRCRSRF